LVGRSVAIDFAAVPGISVGVFACVVDESAGMKDTVG
jgi:hypothetical protein